jgi:aryl carrier-like protein
MLLAGGDALSLPHVRQVLQELQELQELQGCRMINGYGPTECTTFSTLHEVKEVAAQATTVPIGVPLPNAQVYVLDEYREVVPIGVVGELYIGGAGVARGYIGRGALTAERFVPHPFAAGERVYRTGDRVRWNERGELEFIGRTDHQVKVRGYRIELGEIESALNAHAAVSQAVVVAREDVPGEKRLVGYVVAAEGEAPTSSQLREYLRQRLPEYMVPAVVMMLEELLLTPNGKVDRRALQAPEGRPEGVAYEAPRTELEGVLAQIWAEVLRVERVGIWDDFFDVGGDSIRALHVQAEAQKRGYEFSLKELTWLYSPYLPRPVKRKDDESRRLSGLDCDRAWSVLEEIGCTRVFVYAMGRSRG